MIIRNLFLLLFIFILSCTGTNSDVVSSDLSSSSKSSDTSLALSENSSSSDSINEKFKVDTIYVSNDSGTVDTVFVVDIDTVEKSGNGNSSSVSSVDLDTSSSSFNAIIDTDHIDIDLLDYDVYFDTIKTEKTVTVSIDENGEVPLTFYRADGVGTVDASLKIGNAILPISTTDSVAKCFSPENGKYVTLTFIPKYPFVVKYGLKSLNSNNDSSNVAVEIDPNDVDSLYDLNLDPNKERLSEFSSELKVGVIPRKKDDGSFYGVEFTFVSPTDSAYWPDGKYTGSVSYNGITEKIDGQYSSKFLLNVSNGNGLILTFKFDNKIKLYTGVAWNN